MPKLSPRTELCIAAFHFAHGTAASLERDRRRLGLAVQALQAADLPSHYDRQLLLACARALTCPAADIQKARAGVDEILSLACADKTAAGDEAAALQLGMKAEPDLSWQDRADLR